VTPRSHNPFPSARAPTPRPCSMPLRVIRLSAEECQRWCSCLESNYICRNRTEPHALAELFLAHEALSRTAVYVVAESGQEATDWCVDAGTRCLELCHLTALPPMPRQEVRFRHIRDSVPQQQLVRQRQPVAHRLVSSAFRNGSQHSTKNASTPDCAPAAPEK